MSEFTNHKKGRVKMLIHLTQAIMAQQNVGELYKEHIEEIQKLMPADIIFAVDELMQQDIELDRLKKAINKLLNLVYQPINDFPSSKPREGDILWYLQENNREAMLLLHQTSHPLKAINNKYSDSQIMTMIPIYQALLEFTKVYTIKENVLFPLLEREWSDFRCIQMMWSFHDDIKRDLKALLVILHKVGDKDLGIINRLAGDISFRISAIKFRDEKILFPQILDTIKEEKIHELLIQSKDLDYPFVKPEIKEERLVEAKLTEGRVQLGSGALSPEQIKLVFNHLPVDITYVDEHNKVQYYSTPKHRIFPRTNAIIGRYVSHCHPPDSVHVVEQIVEAFRNGKKDDASFWIHMGPHFILIQYFAVRDADQNFRGVVEVSQEISGIQELKGDKRLLDWE